MLPFLALTVGLTVATICYPIAVTIALDTGFLAGAVIGFNLRSTVRIS